jgi:nucleoside-diphosphate-sugar epimerase
MTMEKKVALIAGASGIVGRALMEHLARQEDWKVIGTSRRPVQDAGSAEYLCLDLLDAEAVGAARQSLREVTHVFFTAYNLRRVPAEEVEFNLRMLRNVVEVVESASPRLAHIQLIHGSKWYGSQYGAYRTPAREDQSRHPIGVFYYAQQDWLSDRQAGKRWSWSALRPHGIWGFAVGSQLNMMQAVAVYATVLKHMGLPLHFPGKPGAYNAVYQMTEASHLAKAMVWAATSPKAANEAFNITNGDFVRWKYAWPLVAESFGMEVGEVRPFDVAQFMSDKEPMWAQIRERHGLKPYRIADLTSWDAAISYLFNADWDQMSASTKAQKAGWTEVVDSFEMIPRQFERLAGERAIPAGHA